MSPPRKFDWDEATRLYAQGATLRELAKRYGVTLSGVRYAVDPAARARSAGRRGVCPDCGGETMRQRVGESRPCFKCAGARRAWTVAPDGRLRCATCKEWKAPEEFPVYDDVSTRARGGRRHSCRPCNLAERRRQKRAAK